MSSGRGTDPKGYAEHHRAKNISEMANSSASSYIAKPNGSFVVVSKYLTAAGVGRYLSDSNIPDPGSDLSITGWGLVGYETWPAVA